AGWCWLPGLGFCRAVPGFRAGGRFLPGCGGVVAGVLLAMPARGRWWSWGAGLRRLAFPGRCRCGVAAWSWAVAWLGFRARFACLVAAAARCGGLAGLRRRARAGLSLVVRVLSNRLL